MEEASLLKQGKVGILPTDTLYGLVASALNDDAVSRVYALKGRTATKKCITLISSLADLSDFGVVLTDAQREVLEHLWPGPVSVVFPSGMSFRLPDNPALISFLKESGPLIAPSANPEGLPPAETIEEAQKYFGDTVDFYKEGGRLSGEPSTLVSLDESGSLTLLRQGSRQIAILP